MSNERLIGALRMLTVQALSIEQSIRETRNGSPFFSGKMTPKAEELLREANLKAIDLAYLIEAAGLWEMTGGI